VLVVENNLGSCEDGIRMSNVETNELSSDSDFFVRGKFKTFFYVLSREEFQSSQSLLRRSQPTVSAAEDGEATIPQIRNVLREPYFFSSGLLKKEIHSSGHPLRTIMPISLRR
jgi:hypothetical protein